MSDITIDTLPGGAAIAVSDNFAADQFSFGAYHTKKITGTQLGNFIRTQQYYHTIQDSAPVSYTQRPILQFQNGFTITDDAGDNLTKIALNNTYFTNLLWALNGNTVGSEQWLGTVDNYGLPFRTNNSEKARFLNTGQFLLNATSLTSANERLQIKTSVNEYGFAHTDGTRNGVSYVDATGFWVGTKSNHTLRLFYNDGTSTMDVGTVSSMGIGGARGVLVGSGDQFFVANRLGVHANGTLIHGTTADNTQYALKVRNSGGVDANNILTVLNDGKVGVNLGATSPTTALHISGSIRMVDGNEGTDKILLSDANGVASWAQPNLSIFASTTSTQLAGIISDETGTGSLVFASSPSLTNPVVGTQSQGDNSTKAASTAYVDTGLSNERWTDHFQWSTLTAPADATGYLATDVPDLTLASSARIKKFAFAGTVSDAVITFNVGTAGSSETVTFYLRDITGATDYLIGTATWDASGMQSIVYTGLSIAVNTTSDYALKVLTPTWVTLNPLSVRGAATLYAK